MESRGQKVEVLRPITQYVMDTEPEKWALYASIGVKKLYGCRTTNFVESENGAAIPMRYMYPYDFSQCYGKFYGARFSIPKAN